MRGLIFLCLTAGTRIPVFVSIMCPIVREIVSRSSAIRDAADRTDCLFRAGRSGFQVLFIYCLSSEVMRLHFAVFAAAILADCFLRAGGCAAGAIVRFRVACISGADAGVRAVTVGRPCAPVVTEDVAGEEGRFLRRTLGTQAADGAGLVVLRLFRAGCRAALMSVRMDDRAGGELFSATLAIRVTGITVFDATLRLRRTGCKPSHRAGNGRCGTCNGGKHGNCCALALYRMRKAFCRRRRKAGDPLRGHRYKEACAVDS